MSPRTHKTVPLGSGLITVVTSGLINIQSQLPFTILEGIAFVVAVIWYFKYCRSYPQTGIILAIIPLFFAWRSLFSYFFYVDLIALAYIMVNNNTGALAGDPWESAGEEEDKEHHCHPHRLQPGSQSQIHGSQKRKGSEDEEQDQKTKACDGKNERAKEMGKQKERTKTSWIREEDWKKRMNRKRRKRMSRKRRKGKRRREHPKAQGDSLAKRNAKKKSERKTLQKTKMLNRKEHRKTRKNLKSEMHEAKAEEMKLEGKQNRRCDWQGQARQKEVRLVIWAKDSV